MGYSASSTASLSSMAPLSSAPSISSLPSPPSQAILRSPIATIPSPATDTPMAHSASSVAALFSVAPLSSIALSFSTTLPYFARPFTISDHHHPLPACWHARGPHGLLDGPSLVEGPSLLRGPSLVEGPSLSSLPSLSPPPSPPLQGLSRSPTIAIPSLVASTPVGNAASSATPLSSVAPFSFTALSFSAGLPSSASPFAISDRHRPLPGYRQAHGPLGLLCGPSLLHGPSLLYCPLFLHCPLLLRKPFYDLRPPPSPP